jgi:hypothetical protein
MGCFIHSSPARARAGLRTKVAAQLAGSCWRHRKHGVDAARKFGNSGGSGTHHWRPVATAHLVAGKTVTRRRSSHRWRQNLHGEAMGNIKHGGGVTRQGTDWWLMLLLHRKWRKDGGSRSYSRGRQGELEEGTGPSVSGAHRRPVVLWGVAMGHCSSVVVERKGVAR